MPVFHSLGGLAATIGKRNERNFLAIIGPPHGRHYRNVPEQTCLVHAGVRTDALRQSSARPSCAVMLVARDQQQMVPPSAHRGPRRAGAGNREASVSFSKT